MISGSSVMDPSLSSSLFIDFTLIVRFSRLKKYFDFDSPSSYHCICDLIIAPWVFCLMILGRYVLCSWISSYNLPLSFVIFPDCVSNYLILCSNWIISVLIAFFCRAPYLIDCPRIDILIVSHSKFGLASLLIMFASLIVFFIKWTYSRSLRWLQWSFHKPLPRTLSFGMNSRHIREWSDR